MGCLPDTMGLRTKQMTSDFFPEYEILRAKATPEFRNLWDGPAWRDVPFLEISHFRPEGTDHRPHTRCKLLFDRERLYGHFRVQDRYVRSVHSGFQGAVYKDSCVEIFLMPKPGHGYFNFEFNCGGAMLASHVIDPTRVQGGPVARATPLIPDQCRKVRIRHSLPSIVEPEIAEETVWHLEFSVPFLLLEEFISPLSTDGGETWQANLYKCGSETSHPHWASWSPISAVNFHAPWSFGTLRFSRR